MGNLFIVYVMFPHWPSTISNTNISRHYNSLILDESIAPNMKSLLADYNISHSNCHKHKKKGKRDTVVT